MTGIEELRHLAQHIRTKSATGYVTVVASHHAIELEIIADQIERERACDEDAIETIRLIVGRVIDDMERHVSGVEGMEDSPVARWARELREALGGNGRDPADLLPAEDAEAVAWVREHGGLDHVKSEWRSRVPYDRYERRRQSLLRHIAECETALGRRNQRIEELGKHIQSLMTENADMRKRLMPDGMEWPTVDGKPVDFVTGYEPSIGVLEAVSIYSNGACEVMGHDGIIKGVKEIHVATPKVLDADGVDTSVGDTVYDVDTGEKMWVCALPEQGAYQCVKLRLINGMFKTLDPCRFTHEPPDSWERLWDDIEECSVGYEGFMRRAKALAERGER